VLAATLKVGYIPIFVSPRNSVDGNISLLKEANCEIFLTGTQVSRQVSDLKDKLPRLTVFSVPSVREGGLFRPMLSDSPYMGRHSRNEADPSIILHTSGSTGMYFIMLIAACTTSTDLSRTS
jgi:acyl-coenzyme A synthetase/AMP-(fatty) acid ligase